MGPMLAMTSCDMMESLCVCMTYFDIIAAACGAALEPLDSGCHRTVTETTCGWQS